MASSSFRLSSAALATALTSVLMVLTPVTLPAGAEESIVALFEGPGCTGNAQVFSDLGACHNITTSTGGMRFAPSGGASALLYTSADCSDGSLGGVLGGATRAAGGLLGAVANATDGSTGILRGITNIVGGTAGGSVARADGTFLFCNSTLTFQSFKLQAGTK